MQTFITHPDPQVVARHLDWRRLNKQITESLQIIRSNVNGVGGWRNHPAVKMWQGHEHALAAYDLCMIEEWWRRGYDSHNRSADQIEQFLNDLPDTGWPGWWGDPDLIRSHQSNLIRKDHNHYGPLFPGVPDDLDYVWPTH
jgi:hypothetical protein